MTLLNETLEKIQTVPDFEGFTPTIEIPDAEPDLTPDLSNIPESDEFPSPQAPPIPVPARNFEEEVKTYPPVNAPPDPYVESSDRKPKDFPLASREGKPTLPTITGTVASVLAPKPFWEFQPKDLTEETMQKLFVEINGYPQAKRTILYNENEAKSVVDNTPKTILNEATEMLRRPTVYLRGEDPKYLTEYIKGSPEGAKTNRHTDSGLSGLGATALKVLSYEENKVVEKWYQAFQMPEKADLQDYTYTNFLIDRGLPNNIVTHAMGFSMGVFGVPSTYLTFGTTGMAKLGGKVVLTGKGLELASMIKRERLAEAIAAQEGKAITDKAINSLAKDIDQKVNNELINKFQVIQKQTETVAHGSDVAHLPNSVFDYGGINLQVPFTNTKYNLVEGEQIANIAKDIGIVKLQEYTNKLGTMYSNTKASKVIGLGYENYLKEPTRAFYKEFMAPSVNAINQVKNAVGKIFVPGYGKPTELLDIIRDATISSEKIKLESLKEAEGFFVGLSKKQREEFAETAIYFDQKYPNHKVNVETFSGDSKVQERLDMFYGQGKFEGQKSYPDKIKELLGERADLIEDTIRPNWFPGILQDVHVQDLNIKENMRGAQYLKERDMLHSDLYTRDPVQALSVRLSQIGFSKIQDEAYKKAVSKGFGGMITSKEYAALSEVAREEYAAFKAPMAPYLFGEKTLAERANEATYYVKKDFAKAWEEGFAKDEVFKVPFFSAANRLYKNGVTLTFPAYYARNWRSNIVFNAHSIGLQALNPKTNLLATDMVLGRNLEKTFITDTGERLTLRDLMEEAKIHGVTGQHDPFFDIAGEQLKGEAKKTWELFFSRMNPVGPDFAPFKAGAKLNQVIEDQSRLVNYMTWRKRGADPRMAAMESIEAMLDYKKISPELKNWGGLAIPFITFQAKNLERYVKLIAHRPGFNMEYVKAMRDFGPTDAEWDSLPEHMKNEIQLRFGNLFYSGSGFGIEDALQNLSLDVRGFAGKINPMFRVPIEALANRQFLTGRPLDQVNAADEFKFIVKAKEKYKDSPFIQALTQPFIDAFDLKRDPSTTKAEKITGDPFRLHALRALFTSRWQSTIGLMQKDDYTAAQLGAKYLLGVVTISPDLAKMAALDTVKTREAIYNDLVRKRVIFKDTRPIPKYDFLDGYVEMVKDLLTEPLPRSSLKQIEKTFEETNESVSKAVRP